MVQINFNFYSSDICSSNKVNNYLNQYNECTQSCCNDEFIPIFFTYWYFKFFSCHPTKKQRNSKYYGEQVQVPPKFKIVNQKKNSSSANVTDNTMVTILYIFFHCLKSNIVIALNMPYITSTDNPQCWVIEVTKCGKFRYCLSYIRQQNLQDLSPK